MSLFVLTESEMVKRPVLMQTVPNRMHAGLRLTWRDTVLHKSRRTLVAIFVANLLYLGILDALLVEVAIQIRQNKPVLRLILLLAGLFITGLWLPSIIKLFNFLQGVGYTLETEQMVLDDLKKRSLSK